MPTWCTASKGLMDAKSRNLGIWGEAFHNMYSFDANLMLLVLLINTNKKNFL